MIWNAAQRGIAATALVILSPVLAVIAIGVRFGSPGPALFRSVRLSTGRPFMIYKYRTMRLGAIGIGVTVSGDPRTTPFGRFLRRSKLDELPQLWNVVRGEMLLVGPRPEDPQYVELEDPLHREVFRARPGMTGPTALAFRDEEEILAREAMAVARDHGRTHPTAGDIDAAYRERVLPRKLAMDAHYLRDRSALGDLAIIARTFGQVLRRTTAD